MKTERMTVLVTPEQKAAILSRAQTLGVSAGEMLRRAVEAYDPAASRASEDETVLAALAAELLVAAKAARRSLDDANREVESTLKDLARRRKADGRG
jgi:hypothetical protein